MRKLPAAKAERIKNAVNDLFTKLKTRLLGPHKGDKRLEVTFNREKSLPGIYEAAHLDEHGIPDKQQLNQLLDITENYLDAARLKAQNRTLVRVRHAINIDPEDFEAKLGEELTTLYGEVKSEVHKIVDSEAQQVRSVGVLDGIVRINADLGIDDPSVFFVTTRDEFCCDECKRLHLLKNNLTPRVWKMSEVTSGYHTKGDDHPSIGGLHPSCRCSLTTLMPGFGFNSSGMVAWKGQGWDEYARQREADF